MGVARGYGHEGVHSRPIGRFAGTRKAELDTNVAVATRVSARYVEAAVGRRISRRWALN